MKIESIVPGFTAACTRIHDGLMGFAFAVLVISIVVFIVTQPPEPMGWVRHLIRLFLVMLLITHVSQAINALESWVDSFLTQYAPARPDQVAELYRAKLDSADTNAAETSWWSKFLNSTLFESIVYAVLYLVAQAASAVQFYVSLFQQTLLWFCWAISPVLFSFFSIPRLSGIATQHVIRIVGLCSWNLGLAFASAITEGLIASQVEPFSGVAGGVRHVILNLLALAVIGVYVIVSSIVAPLYMQMLIGGGVGALLSFQQMATSFANRTLPQVSRMASARLFPALSRAWPTLAAGGSQKLGANIDFVRRWATATRPSPSASFPKDDPTGDKTIAKHFHES